MKNEKSMEQTLEKQKRKSYTHSFRLSEEDNSLFLKLYVGSGIINKTKFICTLLFNREIKVVKIDKNSLDYCALLTDFYNQYRAIGVNYNQTVHKINASLSQSNADYYIGILKKYTIELIEVSENIYRLSKKLEKIWLPK